MSEALKAGDKVKYGYGSSTGEVLATNRGNDGSVDYWVRRDEDGSARTYGEGAWTLIPTPRWEVCNKYTTAADDHKIVYHVVTINENGYPVVAWKSLNMGRWIAQEVAAEVPGKSWKLVEEGQ